MIIEGTIRDGVVVLEGSQQLPEGTRVRVEAVPAEPNTSEVPRTLHERYASIIGKATDLPADAARNHDAYLYDEKCQ